MSNRWLNARDTIRENHDDEYEGGFYPGIGRKGGRNSAWRKTEEGKRKLRENGRRGGHEKARRRREGRQ